MLFYFIRHGQTESNVAGLMAGAGTDVPLTEHGHRVARELAASFKHSVHRLWTSDMVRARQTAGYLSEALGLPAEVHADLREWHLGEWEGKPFMEFRHLMLGEGEPAKGESRQAFYTRIETAWRAIHHEQEPYMIVSHGGVWLALQDLLKMPRFKVDNCQVIRVSLQGGQWVGEPIWRGDL